ncbi:MAG TPA: hypothetical protein VFL57_16025 [Bryobacteraceae bacterium]|nr:hypothetical protein [Bryobacteraceae bacterium]
MPERVLRSGIAVIGGLAREVGDIVLPRAVRRTRLYQALVESTLRFLIEQVGEVEGAYAEEPERLPRDFLMRRTAGNGLEAIGLLTLHVSPVWVMAALADVSGAGRQLIPEIAAALQREGILESGSTFNSVEQLLAGLERTSARCAETINTPPLNVAQLREQLAAIRTDAGGAVPSAGEIRSVWRALQQEAGAQGRSVWELSSIMALSAVRVAAARTGATLLDHYRETLGEIHRTGYLRYLAREMKPYAKAAIRQFSPKRVSLTQRLLRR